MNNAHEIKGDKTKKIILRLEILFKKYIIS